MTEGSTIETIGDAVRDAIRQAAPDGLMGSRAGNVIKSVAPDFQPRAYGARNLKEFMTLHVDGVAIIGHSGLDPIWGLTEWATSDHGGARKDEFWRVWVSPRATFVICVDAATGAVSMMPETGAQDCAGVVLPPAAPEVHERIAMEFARDSSAIPSEDLRSELLSLVQSARDGWWREWLTTIRAGGATCADDWTSHRHKRLREELQRSLAETCTSDAAADAAMKTIIQSGYAARPKPPKTMAAGPKERDLRQLVKEVVDRMGDDQLRQVPLPIGLVMDVLAGKR